VKPTGADAALGAEVARAVLGHGLAAQAVVASFSPAVLRAVAAEAPHLRLMGLLDDEADEAAFAGLPVSAWGVAVALVRADRVARWKRGGREVWTWTVVDRDQARRAVEAGVDGLIADIPGAVLEGLVRPGPAV
jgi:glycerophosphoryl diester phosphodiesterase